MSSRPLPGEDLRTGLQGWAMDKEILRLAIPAILQYLLHTLQFLVDTRMVSDALGGGDESLASLNLVSPLCWSLTTIFTVTAIGAGAVVARRSGEGQPLLASQGMYSSIVLALGLGSIVSLLCIAGRDIGLSWLGSQLGVEDSESRSLILSESSGYLTWFLLLFPLRAIAVTLESTTRGAGESLLPVMGGVVSNLVNILGNAIFLYGLWGFPKMGIEGVGLATGLAPLVEVVLILGVLFYRRGQRLSLRTPGALSYHRGQARQIIKLSIPALGAAVLFHSGFVVYQFAIFQLDAMSMAAHRAAIAIQSLAFLPAHGFQAAAASVSGRLLGCGQKKAALRSAWRSSLLAQICITPVIFLLFFFPGDLVGFFELRNETGQLAAMCLLIGACEVPFLMLTETLTGSLRGAGANIPVMWITALGSWGFRVPFAWWLAYGGLGVPAMGLQGVWIATVLDWVVRSGLCVWIVLRRRWLDTEV
ncbi:MAG: MATE family efflux transporter [Planctomycetia bacterium]|nr:MATE family efflux transporter [Planctomycetia bacterium]